MPAVRERRMGYMLSRMRRFIAIVLVASVVVACGDDPDSTTSSSSGKQQTTGGTGTGGGSSSSTSSSSSSGTTSTSSSSGSTSTSSSSGTPTSQDFMGEATYYEANGTGACGSKISDADDLAALNDEQYTKAHCSECAEVKGPNGSVVVKIVDKCPGCKMGDLDLSSTAFAKIAKLSAGRVKITWHFMACP